MNSEHETISLYLEQYGINVSPSQVEELLTSPDQLNSAELRECNEHISKFFTDSAIYANLAEKYGYLLIFLACANYMSNDIGIEQRISSLREQLEIKDDLEQAEDQDQDQSSSDSDEDIGTLVSSLFDRAHREQVDSFRFDLVDIGRALPEQQQNISLSRCVQLAELIKLIVNTGMYGDWVVTEVNSSILQISRLSPNYYRIKS